MALRMVVGIVVLDLLMFVRTLKRWAWVFSRSASSPIRHLFKQI